jgi:DNA mismatch endonuclease, patch repair protein
MERVDGSGKNLSGTPDIVLAKYRTVVFVHGCFWHRHPGCREAAVPKTRTAFWEKKFARNVTRDRRVQRALRKLGWRVIVVWECQVLRDPARVLARIRRELEGGAGRRSASPA